jgi:hypothetical protein
MNDTMLRIWHVIIGILNIYVFYEHEINIEYCQRGFCSKLYQCRMIDGHSSLVVIILQQNARYSVIDLYQQRLLNILLFNPSGPSVLIHHITPPPTLLTSHKRNSHTFQTGTLLLPCVCVWNYVNICSTLNFKFSKILLSIRTCMLIISVSLPCHEFFIRVKVIMCVVVFRL